MVLGCIQLLPLILDNGAKGDQSFQLHGAIVKERVSASLSHLTLLKHLSKCTMAFFKVTGWLQVAQWIVRSSLSASKTYSRAVLRINHWQHYSELLNITHLKVASLTSSSWEGVHPEILVMWLLMAWVCLSNWSSLFFISCEYPQFRDSANVKATKSYLLFLLQFLQSLSVFDSSNRLLISCQFFPRREISLNPPVRSTTTSLQLYGPCTCETISSFTPYSRASWTPHFSEQYLELGRVSYTQPAPRHWVGV